MSLTHLRMTPAFVAVAAAVTLLSAPLAAADPQQQCTDNGAATVCETPGNTEIFAPAPGDNGQTGGGSGPNAADQNGSYGPNGDTPPVGGSN